MVKKEAAAGLPWGSEGYYMGFNLGLFWQTNDYIAPKFRREQSDVPETLQ